MNWRMLFQIAVLWTVALRADQRRLSIAASRLVLHPAPTASQYVKAPPLPILRMPQLLQPEQQ
jgi:hypothetical protein